MQNRTAYATGYYFGVLHVDSPPICNGIKQPSDLNDQQGFEGSDKYLVVLGKNYGIVPTIESVSRNLKLPNADSLKHA